MVTKFEYTRFNSEKGTTTAEIAYCEKPVYPMQLIDRWNVLGRGLYQYAHLHTEEVGDTKEYVHQTVQ